MPLNAIANTLTHIIANQNSRWQCALEDTPHEVLVLEPGGDCHSILDIARHLVGLRRFILMLMNAPHGGLPAREDLNTLDDLLAALRKSDTMLLEAVAAHDESDWLHIPATPREGPWGDECTLSRIAHPINDFTNHLGAIRAIRRINGSPAERSQ